MPLELISAFLKSTVTERHLKTLPLSNIVSTRWQNTRRGRFQCLQSSRAVLQGREECIQEYFIYN